MAKSKKTESSSPEHQHPPGAWVPARNGVQRILAPVERFLAIEAASGIVLMIAAIAALVWANSPWQASYSELWHTVIGIRVGTFGFERELHFWINDGLMTIFFFVVGLEIRREIHAGELSELRRAALPLAAALGGMLVPALIYLALNAGRPSMRGWAIPVATDIAFAVGALALLGKRVPSALRILLLALAVIDDVGAILVIALSYSTGLQGQGLLILLAGMLLLFGLQILGVRSPLAYIGPGIVIWAGTYVGGIHPTLAGVIVGFMTPVTAWFGTERFLDHVETRIRSLRSRGIRNERELLPHLDKLRIANREAVSPVERLQHLLHGWVAFGIMPLFAFANAGVPLGRISFSGDASLVFFGVMFGLVLGKPFGIVAVSWLATRLGLSALPQRVGWSQLSIVGIVGGIGFTMALFIANLAFPAGPLLEISKLAILCASGIAGISTLVVGHRILKAAGGTSEITEAEAEASTQE